MNMPGEFEANVMPSETTDADALIASGAPTTRGIKMPSAPKIPGLAALFGAFACCRSAAVADIGEETFADFIPDEFEPEAEE
jgi:hypothetical protein